MAAFDRCIGEDLHRASFGGEMAKFIAPDGRRREPDLLPKLILDDRSVCALIGGDPVHCHLQQPAKGVALCHMNLLMEIGYRIEANITRRGSQMCAAALAHLRARLERIWKAKKRR